jgi:hypothetical protein
MRDLLVGDCVIVEQGKYANIRLVSSINCAVDQQPEHHKQAAGNCQKAKNELAEAKTDKAIENAVIKVRTLCEDQENSDKRLFGADFRPLRL